MKFTLTVLGKDKHARLKPKQHYQGSLPAFLTRCLAILKVFSSFPVSSELLIQFSTEDIQELHNWVFWFYTLGRLLATTETEEIQKENLT